MDVDIMFGQTPFLILLDIILYGLIYMTLKRTKSETVTKSQLYKGKVLILVFAIFAFCDTDWFHYMEYFPVLKKGGNTNMEEVYYWMASNVAPNYIIFRFVVWGSALYLFSCTLKNLSVRTDLAFFFLGALWLEKFAYSRASLSMALVFYGLSIVIKYKDRRNYLLASVGLVFIFIAFFFHKSSVFCIAVALITLFMPHLGKMTVWLLLIMFPITVYYTREYLGTFLLSEFDKAESSMEYYLSTGQNYMNSDLRQLGIGALVQSFCEKATIYMLAAICVVSIAKGYIRKIPADGVYFIKAFVMIVFVASIFAFDFGVNTTSVFTRFLRYSIVPAPVVFAYIHQAGIMPRAVKVTFMVGVFSVLYIMLYSMYCVYINGYQITIM